MPLCQPVCPCNQSKNLSKKLDRDTHSLLDKTPSQAIAGVIAPITSSEKFQLCRRHSDPGPDLRKLIEIQLSADTGDELETDISSQNPNFNPGILTVQNELEKDETLSHLLHEIRNLRQINRKLSVELFHTKMLLQIAEQNSHYSSEPGSASALVRKLIDAHHAKYNFQIRMPTSSRETLLRFGSASPKSSAGVEDQFALQKEHEELQNKLRAIENKLKERQYSQGGFYQQPKYRPNNGHISASADCLSSTLASPSSSTLTSFEDMNPPLSLNGLDSEVGRPNWAISGWPRVAAFHSTRLNGTNGMENFNSSYLGPTNFTNSHSSLEESRSIDPTPCEPRCDTKHFRSNLSSLI